MEVVEKKILILCRFSGPVVQLDRMSDSGSEGCGFESRRDHQNLIPAQQGFFLFPGQGIIPKFLEYLLWVEN